MLKYLKSQQRDDDDDDDNQILDRSTNGVVDTQGLAMDFVERRRMTGYLPTLMDAKPVHQTTYVGEKRKSFALKNLVMSFKQYLPSLLNNKNNKDCQTLNKPNNGGLVASPTVPKEIFSNTHLLTFKCVSMGLVSLPAEIGKLLNLTHLDVSSNFLSRLPDEIGCLSHLVELSASVNILVELPVRIEGLVKIRSLNVSRNRIVKLPGASLHKLSGLVHVDFSSNRLVAIPESMGDLVLLETLRLEFNGLREIQGEALRKLSALTLLSLDHNHLQVLPLEVGRLTRLQVLDFSNNYIPSLPPELGNATCLTHLLFSNNLVSRIPSDLFRRLPDLRVVSCHGNAFGSCPPTCLSDLLRDAPSVLLSSDFVELTGGRGARWGGIETGKSSDKSTFGDCNIPYLIRLAKISQAAFFEHSTSAVFAGKNSHSRMVSGPLGGNGASYHPTVRDCLYVYCCNQARHPLLNFRFYDVHMYIVYYLCSLKPEMSTHIRKYIGAVVISWKNLSSNKRIEAIGKTFGEAIASWESSKKSIR